MVRLDAQAGDNESGDVTRPGASSAAVKCVVRLARRRKGEAQRGEVHIRRNGFYEPVPLCIPDKSRDAIQDAAAARAKTLNGKHCPNGPTCFIAGTKVLMKQEDDQPVAASEEESLIIVTAASGESGAAAMAAGGVGIGLAIAKSKVNAHDERSTPSRRR